MKNIFNIFNKNSANKIKQLPNELEELYICALSGYKNAYAPYSNFQVGAAVELKNGKTVIGSNIENASYGLTNCAERSALFSVYSMGFRKEDIVRILIVGDTKTPVSPCGACRQVISELMEKDSEVVLTNLNKDCLIYKVSELLPYSFTEGDLNE